MSIPTITEQSYEIREDHTDAGPRLQLVDSRNYWVAAAYKDRRHWSLIVFGGIPEVGDDVPSVALRAPSKEAAIEWLHFIAKLYVKSVTA